MLRTRAIAIVAGLLGFAVLYAGLRWGVMVAGGSDSYGYVSQAGLWLKGDLVVQEDIIRTTPWPDAAETWTPLGYRPSPHRRDAFVPVYAPGLSMLMAVFQAAAGFCGAFLVVPICGASTIWLTYLLGRRIFGAPGLALWAASLVATSPVFLYQLMNAMSDVPVTAAWTLALLLAAMRRPLPAGLAFSLVVAIRPNLAPLAVVVGLWFLAVEWKQDGPRGAIWSAVRFACGLVPSFGGIAWLNASLYESPLTSGYGTTGDLYSAAFVGANAWNYLTWLIDVETPVVMAAVLYFATPRWFPPAKVPQIRWLLGGSFIVIVGSYLFYRPFDVWWYLRFLLPMWPVMMLLTVAVIDTVVRRWLRPIHPLAIGIVAALLAAHGLATANRRFVFELGRSERRYIDVARFVAAHTDPDAVVLSHQHSGSLRLYAGRLTLRYDILDPAWLDRAVDHLRATGRRPYFVLDGGEVEVFRRRFANVSQAGALNWQPIARLESGHASISVYDALDRRSDSPPLAISTTRVTHGAWLCDPPYSRPPVLRMK